MSEKREHMSERMSKWLSTLHVDSADDGKGDDGNLDIRKKNLMDIQLKRQNSVRQCTALGQDVCRAL